VGHEEDVLKAMQNLTHTQVTILAEIMDMLETKLINKDAALTLIKELFPQLSYILGRKKVRPIPD